MTDVSQRADPTASQGSTTGQVKDTVQEGMQQAKDRAVETTQQVRGQAGERLREQVDQRSTQVGEQATSLADSIRRTGEQLRTEGKNGPARIADQAAERAERLGGYLSQSSADDILRDAENFARRQPWVVALGGAAIGLVAARLLKASSARRYEQYGGGDFSTSYGRGYVSPAERELPAPGADMGTRRVEPAISTTDADIVA